MKIAGNWENGKINHGKWIFPNGTYFESPFVNNYPQGECVWHFINGNVFNWNFNKFLEFIKHIKYLQYKLIIF